MKKAIDAASQTYQSRLLTLCMQALATNTENIKKLRAASQVHQVTAVVKAFESLKKNVLFTRVKRELTLKAMVH